jgi:Tfp pilus assembly protein PilF
MRLKPLIVIGLATLLSACGGTSHVARTSSSGSKASVSTSLTAKAKAKAKATTDAKRKSQLTDDDFKLREIDEVKAPTWLPGVERLAQEAFGAGTKAALESPPRYAEAAKKFEEAIRLDPGFMEAYFNLGMTFERQGKRDAAFDVYQTALEENPDDASASAYVAKLYLGKARTASLQGDEDEKEEFLLKTKTLLDELIAKAPRNEAVNNAMALYWLFMEDLETAERYVKEVLYQEPTNITALNTRGLLNLERGQYLIAEWIFLRKVLERDKNSTEALTNLGYTYIKLGKRPLAMRYFQKALAQDSSNMAVRMNIAAMLLEHLDYKVAYEHYTVVREAEPRNLEAHEGQCDAQYGMGGAAADKKAQFQSAIECYVSFIDARPERSDLYMRIANTYQQQMQDLENAVKFMEIYAAKGNLSDEEKTTVANNVKVLKDIIANGGLKAMSAPPEGDPFAEGGDGASDGFEPMDDDGAADKDD